MTRPHRTTVFALLFGGILSGGCGVTEPEDELDPIPFPTDAMRAGHEVTSAFESIPGSVLNQIRANHRIFYGHTSHGSQIVTGLNMLTTSMI